MKIPAFEPNKLEIAIADRLGIDKQTAISGSMRIERHGDEPAIVRWTGMAELPDDELEALLNEHIRENPIEVTGL